MNQDLDNSDFDVARYRADTPGASNVVHLNNAGAALMPAPVLSAVHTHLDLEARTGGYEAGDAVKDRMTEVYAAVAGLVGAKPHNIALMEHATTAYNAALGSIEFKAGDLLVTTLNDYASNQIAFLALERRYGVEVVRVPDSPDGGVDISEMRAIIQRRVPKLVAVTHVPTSSGLVQPVEEIGPICSSRDVLFLVDACQSVGQMPVDVSAIECDFLSATGRKFVRGPRGTGFLFVSDRALARGLEPLFPDMHGADWIDDDLYQVAPDATRFETWESSIALRLGLGEAARYASDVGLEVIQARVRSLAAQLSDGLSAIPGARVLDLGKERCGIVTMAAEGIPAGVLSRTLRSRGVNTSYVEATSAVIDFRAKHVDAAVRFSPHYYNTEDELEQAVALTAELIREGL